MRRIIAWFFGGIPFEARSRRAIDETLVDWAHEEREAPSRGRRAFATLRGLLAVARVVSISLVREAADLGWCCGLAHRFGVIAGVVALLSVAQASLMLPGLDAAVFRISFMTIPMTLLAVLPPALFLILAWRPAGRTGPTAGTACFLAVASLVLAGWLVPLARYGVNDVLRQSLGSPVPDVEHALPPPSAVGFHVTSWAWLAAAVVTFAAKLARWSPLRSRWWLAAVPAIYAAFLPSLQFAIGTSFLVFRDAGAKPESTAQAFALWATAALVMAAAAAYRREAATPSPAN
jgi:hypothetical protein